MVTAGLFGVGFSGRLANVGGTATSTHLSAAPAVVPHPTAKATPAVGAPSAIVTITSQAKPYWLLPYTLAWSIAPTNITIAPTNTWISVAVLDVSLIGSCISVYEAVGPCPTVANLSVNSSVASGVDSYSLTITNAALTAGGYHNGVLPPDQFVVYVWVTLNNGVSNVTVGAEREPYLVPANPTAGFIAPLMNVSVSTGNVTIGVNYTGNYITGAQLNIYQGSATTDKLVYSQGLYVPGGGSIKVIAGVAWVVATAGSYLETLNLTTPYGDFVFQSTITVIAAGETVYSNSSTWSNATAFGGASPGAIAAVLLVVGLIIGMVVALALGRSMWGTPKTAPAQAWQAKPANECSVCHQTFATDAELKEHAKTAHGM